MADNPYASPAHDESQPIERFRLSWALTACMCALLSSALLITALAQVRVEQVGKWPEIQYVGPLADWTLIVAISGWVLTAVAGLLGLMAKERELRRTEVILSNICMSIVVINVVASAYFLPAIHGLFGE